jgi:predicted secreted protein
MHGRLLLPLAAAAALAVGAAPAAAKTVTVTAADSGDLVTLRPGDRIRIELDANATTGYRWLVTKRPDRKVVRIASSAYVPDQPPSGEIVVGAGGTQVYVLRAGRRGRTRLGLSYRQVGSEARGSSFDLFVRVRRVS